MSVNGLKNSTAIPDYVDSMGFDNALREMALYAQICGDEHLTSGGNDACRRTFYRVMSVIASCADEVERLMTASESITMGLEQFQEDRKVDHD